MTDSAAAPKFTVDASEATGVVVGDQATLRFEVGGPAQRPVPEARRRMPLRVFGAIPMSAWHFQERPREARELHEALKGRNRAALVAMPGERGAGKSQIAAAYARSCVDSGYDLVAWINAESGPVTELAQLAMQLGVASSAQTVEVQAAAVCRWLGQPGKAKRLIVFDNVDDPDAITGYLPRVGSNKVIITTNRREFATMAGVTTVAVGMFTRSEGLAFLREATGLPPGDDAVAVAEELGWLPLGLAQAAAYIKRARLSYRDYLAVLDRRDLDDVLRRQAGADHPGVLKATQLNLASLERDDPTGSAVRLLAVLSLLSANGVSRDLLTLSEDALGLTIGLDAALNLLTGVCLVSLSEAREGQAQPGPVTVTVHRLTARVVRHQTSQRDGGADFAAAVSTAESLVQAVSDDLPEEQLATRRSELDEVAGHLLALRQHVTDPSERLVDYCRRAGRALATVGDVAEGIRRLTTVVTDARRVLGPDQRITLLCQKDLAHAYRLAGRLDEAIAEGRKVVGPGTGARSGSS